MRFIYCLDDGFLQIGVIEDVYYFPDEEDDFNESEIVAQLGYENYYEFGKKLLDRRVRNG